MVWFGQLHFDLSWSTTSTRSYCSVGPANGSALTGVEPYRNSNALGASAARYNVPCSAELSGDGRKVRWGGGEDSNLPTFTLGAGTGFDELRSSRVEARTTDWSPQERRTKPHAFVQHARFRHESSERDEQHRREDADAPKRDSHRRCHRYLYSQARCVLQNYARTANVPAEFKRWLRGPTTLS
jgi:hypothetical protein